MLCKEPLVSKFQRYHHQFLPLVSLSGPLTRHLPVKTCHSKNEASGSELLLFLSNLVDKVKFIRESFLFCELEAFACISSRWLLMHWTSFFFSSSSIEANSWLLWVLSSRLSFHHSLLYLFHQCRPLPWASLFYQVVNKLSVLERRLRDDHCFWRTLACTFLLDRLTLLPLHFLALLGSICVEIRLTILLLCLGFLVWFGSIILFPIMLLSDGL